MEGNFWISWNAATLADNYTIYSYSSMITEINGSLTYEGYAGINTKWQIINKARGTYYIVIAARNKAGTTISNNIIVNILRTVWEWVSGNDTIDAYGHYGEKGNPALDNYPGARYTAVSWKDTKDNLWLFGGGGNAESTFGYLNDLWMFNISSVLWTWVSGNNSADVYGIYGEKGTPDINNYPGARQGAISWKDADDNLWLFGGEGFATSDSGYLNDLWMFNISSKIWTWVSGNFTSNQYGYYGIKGEAASTNYPRARYNSISQIDLDNNLWLIGGYGKAETGSNGYLNDLWMFNISSETWTWVSGNETTNVYGKYGIQGTPDIDNYPGCRSSFVLWIDSNNNFWLFGGAGNNEIVSSTFLNDLWMFNISSKMWTWMNGSKDAWANGQYGIKGTPSINNYPGSRSQLTSWMDQEGNIWLFGGNGYGATGAITGDLNDLWILNITSNLWTWISGNKTLTLNGVYGENGVPAIGNYPGSRRGMVSWISSNDNLWVFGGDGFPKTGTDSFLNDLWRFYI